MNQRMYSRRGFGDTVSTEVVGTPVILSAAQIQAMNTPPPALSTPTDSQMVARVVMMTPLTTPVSPAPQVDPNAVPTPALTTPLVQPMIATSESVPLTSTTDLASRILDQSLPSTGPYVDPNQMPPPPAPKNNNGAIAVAAIIGYLLLR